MKLALLAAAFLGIAGAQPPETLRKLLMDWGGLTRYGSENTELRAPKPGETRVVFFGDDITENWIDFFPGRPQYLNRGISRQTTPQMLVRFRQDVIELKPKVVIIEGGGNDLAGFTGPATEPMTGENLESMVELAKLHGIRVVLASVLPGRAPIGKIIGLNGWIRRYAQRSGSVYLNYYSALTEARAFKKDLTADGVLPNRAGYVVMTGLTEEAIAEALR